MFLHSGEALRRANSLPSSPLLSLPASLYSGKKLAPLSVPATGGGSVSADWTTGSTHRVPHHLRTLPSVHDTAFAIRAFQPLEVEKCETLNCAKLQEFETLEGRGTKRGRRGLDS